jgi:CheY-like chemotaxis protein
MAEAESRAHVRLKLPTRPVVVLAIDDEDRRATSAYAITAAGFDVTTSDQNPTRADPSGPVPDIVVADLAAGSRHGWTLVRKLKHDSRTSDIPVIAVAADIEDGTREFARREGCAAVCPMTCPADVLTSGIRAVLNHRFR